MDIEFQRLVNGKWEGFDGMRYILAGMSIPEIVKKFNASVLCLDVKEYTIVIFHTDGRREEGTISTTDIFSTSRQEYVLYKSLKQRTLYSTLNIQNAPIQEPLFML